MYTDANDDNDTNNDNNDTRQTNHDYIGSLACMPNEPMSTTFSVIWMESFSNVVNREILNYKSYNTS